MAGPPEPLRVLFLCTGNSARSQMAEAILNHRSGGRFAAQSGGSAPASRVNPEAIEVLREHGIPWTGHVPRGLEGLADLPWDVVITVCDRAREACPIFPGQPLQAHWGMPDPAEVSGHPAARRRAFRKAFQTLARRIDRLRSLPIEQLGRSALLARLEEIGADPDREP